MNGEGTLSESKIEPVNEVKRSDSSGEKEKIVTAKIVAIASRMKKVNVTDLMIKLFR